MKDRVIKQGTNLKDVNGITWIVDRIEVTRRDVQVYLVSGVLKRVLGHYDLDFYEEV